MTIIELSRKLSNRAADEVTVGSADGKRFSASQRLDAINSAVVTVVDAILGASTPKIKTHDMLQTLLTVEVVDVHSAGYALTDFASLPAAGGIKFIEMKVAGDNRAATERTVDELRFRRNKFLAGSDLSPTYYLEAGKLMAEVSLGSYPVVATVHYIRVPKQAVYAGAVGYQTVDFELGDNLSEPVLSYAETLLYKSTDETDRIKAGLELYTQQVGAVVTQSHADNEMLGGIKQ